MADQRKDNGSNNNAKETSVTTDELKQKTGELLQTAGEVAGLFGRFIKKKSKELKTMLESDDFPEKAKESVKAFSENASASVSKIAEKATTVADSFIAKPLDRDGVTEMRWDENMKLYRSHTDPFWFADSTGKHFYSCSSFDMKEKCSRLPYPDVWDYLIRGYEGDYRNALDQIVFFAEKSKVRTMSYPEFAELEKYLKDEGYVLSGELIEKGLAPAKIKIIIDESRGIAHDLDEYEEAGFKYYDVVIEPAPEETPAGEVASEAQGANDAQPKDEKDRIIERLENEINSENEVLNSVYFEYEVFRGFAPGDPGDPLYDAYQLDLNSGDPRDDKIKVLISSLELTRGVIMMELNKIMEEHEDIYGYPSLF